MQRDAHGVYKCVCFLVIFFFLSTPTQTDKQLSHCSQASGESDLGKDPKRIPEPQGHGHAGGYQLFWHGTPKSTVHPQC